MSGQLTLGILSDIHYASAAEQARGRNYELAGITNPFSRMLVRFYRRFIWLNDPLHQNHLLDHFFQRVGNPDYVIANGDYSCNSASIGVADDAACQSVRECTGKLRERFGDRLRIVYGDHELGKLSFFGGCGGMRLSSWSRAQKELQLEPLWVLQLGRYVLLGIVSSLVALPVFQADALADEWPEWERLRASYLDQLRAVFENLESNRRVLLFCHDPSALPFLWREPSIQSKIGQIEQTVIGHLHSNLILWKSRWLSGMPRITFLGHTPKRLTTALREARHWRAFRVRLCPSLAGTELLKDGGFLTASLDPDARRPIQFQAHRIARS